MSRAAALPVPRFGLMAPVYGAALAFGLFLAWMSEYRPAAMPAIGPFDFSPPEYGLTVLVAIWFVRGLVLTPAAERLPVWRCALFVLGLGLVYLVLQTQFEYWAQHMFFINRIQHVVMHHLGPFLMALGLAGGTIKRGMPDWLQRALAHPAIERIMKVLQNPYVAVLLFSGTFALWLIPAVHFRAMIDLRLYALMNWTMVLDGVLFWTLVLDPRPNPPARTGYGTRLAMAIFVMFPQIIMGAVIGFSTTDLYPYYDLCGRLLPDFGVLNDQHVGGVIIWIPPAMMSAIAAILVLNALRAHEDQTRETDPDASRLADLASSWTGR